MTDLAANTPDASPEKVIQLKAASPEPNQSVIRILEAALDDAKSGELRSVAIVGDLSGNMLFRAVSMEDGIALLGHLSRAQFATNMALISGDDE